MYKRLMKSLRRHVFFALGGKAKVALETIGTTDQWTCKPSVLDAEAVVVSGGVGKSITFELGLMARTGCKVHLFDPSPTGIGTMQITENRHPGIIFHPIGLSGEDGVQTFDMPDRSEEGSWKKGKNGSMHSFECRSISSFAKQNNWKRIDLLKLDIEGFEYEVLNDVLKSGIPIGQVCVEFHTNRAIDIEKTAADLAIMLWKMRNGGFRIAHVKGADFTFVSSTLSRGGPAQ